MNNVSNGDGDTPSEIEVSVCYALPFEQIERHLRISPQTSVREAVELSGIKAIIGVEVIKDENIGVYGQLLDGQSLPHLDEYQLQDGDRIEIYRPLPIDPKEARRQRAANRQIKHKP